MLLLPKDANRQRACLYFRDDDSRQLIVYFLSFPPTYGFFQSDL